MSIEICSTATCQCSKGTSPTIFNGSPENRVVTRCKPIATIMDNKLGVNFPQATATFGKCKSLGNPKVAQATANAKGVLRPQPCTPVFVTPWTPGSPTFLIRHNPVLTHHSCLQCAFGGTVTLIPPTEFRVFLS